MKSRHLHHIQKIYEKLPKKLVDFLADHDYIFTVNYDSNLETVCTKPIYHLHGNFDVLEEIYNANSFRNKLSDSQINSLKLNKSYMHLYSNVILDFSGNYKEFEIKQYGDANKAVEKFAIAYKKDPFVKADIDNWKNDSNTILKNINESIMLKLSQPNLHFSEYYHYDKLDEISGELIIIGLSPNNDTHLFSKINNNNMISKVTYYFYKDIYNNYVNDLNIIGQLLPNKYIVNIDINDLWNSF